MKRYFVAVEIRDGENEYTDYFLIQSKDGVEANRKSLKKMIYNWDLEKEDPSYYTGKHGDCRYFRIDRVEELKDEEAKTLLKFCVVI